MRSDPERIADIQEAIERIERYALRGRAAFDDDELIQTWILHHLQIIGEAARAVTPETQKMSPGIPWAQIIGMRNILVHHYFGIDRDVVWEAVVRDLPPLKRELQKMLP